MDTFDFMRDFYPMVPENELWDIVAKMHWFNYTNTKMGKAYEKNLRKEERLNH